MAEEATTTGGGEEVIYEEVGVDVGGLEGPVKQNPETASQLGRDETDGKGTKKRKKAAQRIIQDGQCLQFGSQFALYRDLFTECWGKNVLLVVLLVW